MALFAASLHSNAASPLYRHLITPVPLISYAAPYPRPIVRVYTPWHEHVPFIYNLVIYCTARSKRNRKLVEISSFFYISIYTFLLLFFFWQFFGTMRSMSVEKDWDWKKYEGIHRTEPIWFDELCNDFNISVFIVTMSLFLQVHRTLFPSSWLIENPNEIGPLRRCATIEAQPPRATRKSA